MATDLETGEVGNAWELLAKSIERRNKRWNEHLNAGRLRVFQWKVTHRFGARRLTPTRFYKLMHNLR